MLSQVSPYGLRMHGKQTGTVVGVCGISGRAQQLLLCHLEVKIEAGSSSDTGYSKHLLGVRAISCNASSSTLRCTCGFKIRKLGLGNFSGRDLRTSCHEKQFPC